jgi:hypothetical protein
MNRLLLTLLALLTGLAAQVSPATATARSAGETEIGQTETQLARRVEAAAALNLAQAARVQSPAVVTEKAPLADLALPKRAVLTRIDRARE